MGFQDHVTYNGTRYDFRDTGAREQIGEVKSDLGYTPAVEYEIGSGYFNGDGSINASSDYAQEKYTVTYIPVKAGKTLKIDWIGDTYDRAIWIAYMLYDSNQSVIGSRQALYSGTASSYSGSLTIPAGAAYIRFTWRSFGVATFTISRESLYELIQGITKNIHYVSADGSRDFSSISDAVSVSADDDIIIVYPGTYSESVNALSKRVHIIGTDKATCVLTYSGLDYAHPPLEMAKGSVRNMTIKATNSGSAGSAKAYCVHIDNNNSANEGLSFFNCDFINAVHQAVGIGLRAHFTLSFDGCRFESVNAAALYCHDWETSDASADKTGQKLIVKNSVMVNNSSENTTILLQTQEIAEACATCEFNGNAVLNRGDGTKLIYMYRWAGRTLTNNHFLGSSDWVLSDVSALNTLATINAIS